MSIVYVCSTSGFSGKTLALLGLGQFFKKKNIPFSYRKPVGNRPVYQNGYIVDDDAAFLAKVFELDVPLDKLSAVILTQDTVVKGFKGELEALMPQVLTFCEEAQKEADVLLLGGYGSLYSGKFLGISGVDLAKSLNAHICLVVRYEGEYVVDYILQAAQEFPEQKLGVIFNDIREEHLYNYQDLIKPYLEKKGIEILGEIPHHNKLAAVSVKDLREYLGARLLGHTAEDRLVESFLIGGMQVDKAIQYFRKLSNFGVIVGGDRSDIQLAAIETGAVCLILTGGLYPNEIILARAEEKQVAILIAKEDTYSVARRTERLPGQARIRHPEKLSCAFEITARSLDYDKLAEFVS
ncbi:DRTGG domain protein [Thermodesulfatator indicus DSM 15286]|uniref:DRTGG domain protein n=1 Tax=Thermodesulfatator indicus (strain DSM 15286 / JCM 11887 / CIR29812) TaxID=667014 RepID=F8AA99_THEID|nr:phosphotransacetylase family protein [Thermodesulfatator indicus]AEH44235.1 DRTGG domain protein [Thermodesulfatator indicus DSM 15286]